MRLLNEDDVVKAVDKHTSDDGRLDDDITCILEEVPAKFIPEYMPSCELPDNIGLMASLPAIEYGYRIGWNACLHKILIWRAK